MHTSLPYSSHRSTSLQGSVLAAWVVLTVVARGVVVTTLVVLCVVVPESPTITQNRYYKDPRSSVATDSLFLLLDWHTSTVVTEQFAILSGPRLVNTWTGFFSISGTVRQSIFACWKNYLIINTDNLLIKCRIRSHYDF